jgi:hypothetical protein
MEADASIVDLNQTCHFDHRSESPDPSSFLSRNWLYPPSTARCDVRAQVERALRRGFNRRAQGDGPPPALPGVFRDRN